MLKCFDCGFVFEEEEALTAAEDRGEHFGFPASEECRVCPKCGGSFEDMMDCKICGEAHIEDELSGGVCNSCIEKHSRDFSLCFSFGKRCETEITINGFLASMLSNEKIESILYNHIRFMGEAHKDYDCKPFIEDDKSWFGEQLAKEV